MSPVREPKLEHEGRRFGQSGGWFLLLAGAIAAPGILLIAFGGTSASAVGVVVLVFAAMVALVALALLLSSAVARWAARHRPFA